MKGGKLDYVWLWILCGLPFGLHRMCLWIISGGGSLGGGRDRPVCPQLHSGRCDRRLRPGMAADRGRVLCTLDCIPPDRWVKKTASWKCGKH